MKKVDYILILDFGSQYTQLIARRIRDMKVYCEIHPYYIDIKQHIINENIHKNVIGIILSGGPSTITDKEAPFLSLEVFKFILNLHIPILGICYGLHLLAVLTGGKVVKSTAREYGNTKIFRTASSRLLAGTKSKFISWMSHGDTVKELSHRLIVTSQSNNNVISSFEDPKNQIYATQFHPEVTNTEYGTKILKNFVFRICKAKNLFEPESFVKSKIKEIQDTVKDKFAICALSGGVDSSVAAVLSYRALKKNLICIHIDNGLLRKNESLEVVNLFKNKFGFKLIFIDASELFLKRLKNVIDPERKRKIIGKTFIEVFEQQAEILKKQNKNIQFLIQGTIYPDVIESAKTKGPAASIKSHHNVGGLPDKMKLKIVEPLRELFKDEVRRIGVQLGIPQKFLKRHPFPGPGLAVRIIGDIDKNKLSILKEVDDIFIKGLHKHKLYNKIWQAFAVLLPIKTVGVMGDERSYENVVALRAVTSQDGMTADFYYFQKSFFSEISNQIINNVKGINRVVYDISSKPPSTIEWE
ncbi:MAG: glutamine-hydrolyzing GMP synthase [Ignavibacteria bacterium]